MILACRSARMYLSFANNVLSLVTFVNVPFAWLKVIIPSLLYFADCSPYSTSTLSTKTVSIRISCFTFLSCCWGDFPIFELLFLGYLLSLYNETEPFFICTCWEMVCWLSISSLKSNFSNRKVSNFITAMVMFSFRALKYAALLIFGAYSTLVNKTFWSRVFMIRWSNLAL